MKYRQNLIMNPAIAPQPLYAFVLCTETILLPHAWFFQEQFSNCVEHCDSCDWQVESEWAQNFSGGIEEFVLLGCDVEMMDLEPMKMKVSRSYEIWGAVHQEMLSHNPKERNLGMFKTFVLTFPLGKQLKSSLRLDDFRVNFRTRSGCQATCRCSV